MLTSEKIVEATVMAKKMDRRLRQYQGDWDKDEWEWLSAEEVKRRQKERAMQYINELTLKIEHGPLEKPCK